MILLDVQTAAKQSFIDLLIKGGWLMIPLILLSLVSIFIFFDRYFFIKGQKRMDQPFFEKLKELIRAGQIDTALALCSTADCSETRILAKGISNLGKPIGEIYDQMEREGKLEVYKYESNLYFLGVIAGVAPMLGFIGTISGVIKIFYNISLADNISISLISGGLYEKLITSGVGLTIGILAYIAYHFINNKINKTVQAWEYRSVRFIDLINQKG